MTAFLPSREFIRFCIVGAVGFVVDAGGLLALVALHLAGPLWGRAVSFSLAICTTFVLNRIWAFEDTNGPVLVQALRYLGVQGMGFLVNFLVYAVLFSFAPGPLAWPLVAIAIASGCALVVNYAGNKLFVFPASLRDAEPF